MTDTVKLEGLPHQIEFWKHRIDRTNVAMVGGYGSGKTFGLVVNWILLKFENDGVHDMLVEPTYRKILDTLLPQVEYIGNDIMGLGLRYVGGDVAEIRWPNGFSPTFVRSAERPDLLSGPNLASVGWDEPGLMNELAWKKGMVRPRHPKAKCRINYLTGTPEGMGWFAKWFNYPQHPQYTIRAKCWHPDIGPYWEVIRNAYAGTPHLLKAYERGHFVPMATGRVYHAFDRDAHVSENGELGYHHALPLLLTCDFNIDHMRWSVAQRHPGQVQYLDELAPGPNTSAAMTAEEFVNRYHPDRGAEVRHTGDVIVTGDATGQGRNATGTVCYDEIMSVLAPGGKPIWRSVRLQVPRSNPPRADSFRTANHHLASNKTGRGKRILIHPRCVEIIADLETVVRKEGTDIVDTSDPARGHAGDNFRYLLSEFEPIIHIPPVSVGKRDREKPFRDPWLHGAF